MTNAAHSPFEILARYERLSLAHASDTPENLEAPGLWRGIGYRAGDRTFVSAIDEINELLAVPGLTPVPGTLPWLLGVANVRGNLVPVVDLGRFLFGERTTMSERTRLLVVRQGGGNVALLVDEVFGQRTVDAEQRSHAEHEEDPRLSRFADDKVAVGEQQFTLLSMNKLVRAPDFRQAAA
ncbi:MULTISPECIES: chemotaxis protein CheW [Rhodanobacter]|jgi:twitching motility protein PilI|uniref:Chemotaxis protein CheW n=1 Tax=Rhodanobacter glycinis TaxID=582702 RepID=A0A1I4FFU1_9GAMM|nr:MULTISPECIES: chemotaxis protein CheW [Rhodanobacter]EIL95599.1 chemotaxis signal transduction protein pili [Rhodanobacter sp. 115]QEE23943.1 chemotaxis protein CheW [Rhodanobacter glycinis]TAM23284.1 MAG: chemotaxis protein CheW [Rhodanobacter sp.]SFL16814.1 twitching motility protein PilI [Rhodanobacter glycinis]